MNSAMQNDSIVTPETIRELFRRLEIQSEQIKGLQMDRDTLEAQVEELELNLDRLRRSVNNPTK